MQTFTRDHALVVQAAHALRSDQPLYARTILNECDQPLQAAVELVGLLMAQRAEQQQAPA